MPPTTLDFGLNNSVSRAESFGSQPGLRGADPYHSGSGGGDEGMQPGAGVVIYGVVAEPELNGVNGHLLSFDSRAKRWRVMLENGQERDISEENMAITGDHLQSMQSSPSKASPPGTSFGVQHSGYVDPAMGSMPLPVGSLNPGGPPIVSMPPGAVGGSRPGTAQNLPTAPSRSEFTRDNMMDHMGQMDTQTTLPAGYSQPPTQMMGTPSSRLPGVSETGMYTDALGQTAPAMHGHSLDGRMDNMMRPDSRDNMGKSQPLPSAVAARERQQSGEYASYGSPGANSAAALGTSNQMGGRSGSFQDAGMSAYQMPGQNSMPAPGTDPHLGYSRPNSGYVQPGSGGGYARPDSKGAMGYGQPGTKDSQATLMGINHSYPDDHYLAPNSGGSTGTLHGLHDAHHPEGPYSRPGSGQFHIGSMAMYHGQSPGYGGYGETAPPAPIVGKLRVRIIAGYNLRNTDLGVTPGEVSDPFVVLRLGQTEHKTKVVENNLNPRWNSENFWFQVIDEDQVLLMEVFNANQFYAHDSLGRLEVPIHRVVPGEVLERTESLLEGGNGRLEYEILYVPPEKVAQMEGSGFPGMVRPSSGMMRPSPFMQTASHQPKVQHKIPLPDFHGMGPEAFAAPPPKPNKAPVGEMRRQMEYQSFACRLGQYDYKEAAVYFPEQAQIDKRAWQDDPFYGWRSNPEMEAGNKNLLGPGQSRSQGAKELEKWRGDPFDGWLHFDKNNQPVGDSEKILEARAMRKMARLPSFQDAEKKRFDDHHGEYVGMHKIGGQQGHHALKDRDRAWKEHPRSNWKDDAFFGWLPNRGEDSEMVHALHRPLEKARLDRLPSFSENVPNALTGKGIGVLKVWINRAYRLEFGANDAKHQNERPSACVKLQLGNGKERWTPTVESYSNPSDNDRWCMDWQMGSFQYDPFQFEVESKADELVMEVIDYLGHHKVDQTFLGRYVLPARSLMEQYEGRRQDFREEPLQGGSPQARLQFSAMYQRYTTEDHGARQAIRDDSTGQRRPDSGGYQLRQESQQSGWNRPGSMQSNRGGPSEFDMGLPPLGELQVKIIRAFNLKDMDSGYFGDHSDPYVTMKLASQGDKERKRTKTINNNLNPVWESPDFIFKVYDQLDKLVLEVYDEDLPPKTDDFIGRLIIPLTKFIDNNNQRMRIKDRLQDIDKESELEVEIGFYFMDDRY